MTRSQRNCAALIAALTLSTSISCARATRDSASIPAVEMSGYLTVRDGGNWFQPCNSAAQAAPIWVTVTGQSVAQLKAAIDAGRIQTGERRFVRMRAAPTDGSVVGPGGPALLAREIMELRAPAAGDCPASGGD